jgi:hypothetical protein
MNIATKNACFFSVCRQSKQIVKQQGLQLVILLNSHHIYKASNCFCASPAAVEFGYSFNTF